MTCWSPWAWPGVCVVLLLTWRRSRAAVAEAQPGCILVETISNPLLRVAAVDRIADIAGRVGAALVVDNTFATPMIERPRKWACTWWCTA